MRVWFGDGDGDGDFGESNNERGLGGTTYRWNPLLRIPDPTLDDRTGQLSHSHNRGTHARLVESGFEDALGDVFRFAVAGSGGDCVVVQRLLGYLFAQVFGVPVADCGDAGCEDDGWAEWGGSGEVDEVTGAGDVRSEGSEGEVEVDLPLVIWV